MWSESLRELGFAVIPDVFPLQEIDALSVALTHADVQRSRAGVRHALRHPKVAALARDSRLRSMAQAVLGAGAFPFRATLFDKSPKANWLVSWHQDTALPLRVRRDVPGWGPWSIKEGVTYAHAPASALSRVLTLRVHLDDSTRQNGPLRVLPGTHSSGVLDDEAVRHLAATVDSVDCLVCKGGVLAMRPLIVHSSSKSSVEASRRVLHIEYAETASLGDGLELAAA